MQELAPAWRRIALAKIGIDGELPMSIVIYLAMATAVSLAVWFCWLD